MPKCLLKRSAKQAFTVGLLKSVGSLQKQFARFSGLYLRVSQSATANSLTYFFQLAGRRVRCDCSIRQPTAFLVLKRRKLRLCTHLPKMRDLLNIVLGELLPFW